MGFQLPTSTGERRSSEPSTVSYNHGIVLNNRFEWSIHPKHSRISNMKKVVIELCDDEHWLIWLPRDFCLKMLTQVKMCLFCFFPKFRGNQLMVNCWFGARWFGFLESPKMKGIGILGCTPIRIPNHRAPNQQAKPLVEVTNSIKTTSKAPNLWIGSTPPQIPRNPQQPTAGPIWNFFFLATFGMKARSKCLEDHPIYKLWMAIWKGSHNPILRGQQRSPWLFTTS